MEEIWSRVFQVLKWRAGAVITNRFDAEDLAQDAIKETVRKNLDSEHAIFAYSYRVLQYKKLHYFRRRRRVSPGPIMVNGGQRRSLSADNAYYFREVLTLLDHLTDLLSREEKIVYALLKQGCNYAEIGQKLEKAPQSVRQITCRLRAKLRKELLKRRIRLM